MTHPRLPRAPRIGAWLFVLVIAALLIACSGGSHPSGGTPLGDDGARVPDQKSWAGKDPAPDFAAGLTWFNVSKPLKLADLKGKVVLLDFWTLGCINCQHIIPDLKRLEAEFGDALVVVGVHSGKYSTEHDDESIREAIGKYGLTHPVVNDPNFVVWKAFGANAWPTVVVIDPAGKLVGGHAGEGVYPLFEPILASLVKEFDANGQVNRAPIPLDLAATTTSTVLAYPGKVLADSAGNRLFIADSGHNRILIATLDGRLTQAIGSGKEGFADGAASEAAFRQPQGLALSTDSKTLYVADTRNHAVRSVDLATGEVTTIAGTGKQLDRVPVNAAKAKDTALASPWDVLAVENTLYISMAGVHQIWALDLPTGTISIFAGTSREGIQDGHRREATLAQPSGLATDGRFLYWVDPEGSAVRRVALAKDANDSVETLVGTGLFDFGDKDGNGKDAKLQHPQGIAYADGQLYVADTYNHKIRAVNAANRTVTTASGTGERGWRDGDTSDARWDEPGGLSAADGKAYIADTNNHLVRVLDLAPRSVTTLKLTNLEVASTNAVATSVQLAAQAVAAGNGEVSLTLKAPAGYHLNGLAPSRVELRPSGAGISPIASPVVEIVSDRPEATVTTAATFAAGAGSLTLRLTAYYCRTGSEALCLIQQVDLALPLTVAAGGDGHAVSVSYTLPDAPTGPKSP